jgi:hypothetical protein
VLGADPDAAVVVSGSSGDQWWPWPLVASLYSSTVGLTI